jgi:hypothetical protein
MPVQSLAAQKVEILPQHPGFDHPKSLGNQQLQALKRGLMSLPQMLLYKLQAMYPRCMHGSNIMQ